MSDSHQPATEHVLNHEVVEGVDARLHVERFSPETSVAADSPPVLLLHGFASSSELNWERPGWVRELTRAGRTVLTVDLPGHGRSGVAPVEACLPSRIRADLLQILAQENVRPIGPDGGGADLIGYSFGARLAWELAAAQPELVRRIVLGGAAANDRFVAFDLASARAHLASGTGIAHDETRMFLSMAQAAGNPMDPILAFIHAAQQEPYHPETMVPRQPVLLVAGENDELAAGMGDLVTLLEDAGGHPETLRIPGRDHLTAVTSRAFKDAATAFLA
ncbi:hydrolase [Tersicoccus solisilvae]|uniref:Hydrolase n=1 Tax=Tersicoccus solisilvae TaxID=1882339 RepID=A0ABQ1PJU2_9MICC|nr:alpha/beta fold hydrolase [Tersicoccus solisilvae]GGC98425.1 hydrolase [Tersicoccus solisilvae]